MYARTINYLQRVGTFSYVTLKMPGDGVDVDRKIEVSMGIHNQSAKLHT